MTRATVSRVFGTYADTWEDFLRDIHNYSPKQHKAMLKEATTSGRLSIIIGAGRSVVRANSAQRARERLVSAQRTIHEEQRWTADASKFRNYADTTMLPPIVLHTLSTTERRSSMQRTSAYWKARNNPTSFYLLRVGRDAKSNYQQHRLVHPFGGPVSPVEINELRARIRPTPTTKKNRVIAVVGMTPARAMQIALASLDRQK